MKIGISLAVYKPASPVNDLSKKNNDLFKQVNEDDFLKAADLMEQDIEKHWKPESNVETQWSDRIGATRGMINASRTTVSEKDYDHLCILNFDNSPIGLMVLKEIDFGGGPVTHIKEIITHPGTQQAGGLLIEHTVNFSETNGNHGKVSLTPIHTAIDAYTALGFKEEFIMMELDPTESDKWTRSDVTGQWELAAYAKPLHASHN
ncbi:hypothetical protein ACVBEF_05785 [Glaciimonas sp. GG7]